MREASGEIKTALILNSDNNHLIPACSSKKKKQTKYRENLDEEERPNLDYLAVFNNLFSTKILDFLFPSQLPLKDFIPIRWSDKRLLSNFHCSNFMLLAAKGEQTPSIRKCTLLC